jgi:hypothetical protein
MAERHRGLIARGRIHLQPHHRIAVVVGLLYLLGSLVIFRGVLFAIPDILRGQRILVGDELVPYFNPTSQLLDQARGDYSELTNGYEFRVRYSFLTTWLRYYPVVPFAVLLVLPAVVWSAYLTTSWFLRRCIRTVSPATAYLATAFPTALVYMIMIYAKITHFYTLVLGLALMTISAMVMLDALLFRTERWGRRMLLACVVTLLNPAVHYLILFALFLCLTVFTLVLGELARWWREGAVKRSVRALLSPRQSARRLLGLLRAPNAVTRGRAVVRSWSSTTIGRCTWAMAALFAVAIVPYGLFVKFVALRGVPNLSETVPGDYYFIKDASVSLVHILSWDLAGIMDKINFGDYLAKVPRVPNMVYTLLFFVPLVVPSVRRSLFPSRAHRQLLGVIYVNAGFAIWATVGYGEPNWFPTFHRSLAALTRTLYRTESPVGDLTLAFSSTIVQVLRFPHRFQLLLFMLAPLIMALPLAWAIERITRSTAGPAWVRLKRDQSSALMLPRIALTVAVGSVFFVPFLSNAPYRDAYGSGNFSGFLEAYPVEDLQALKQDLVERPTGKTVVLPPTETAKLVVDPNGAAHKFIDKFYIYYLDQPSFYYGLTGDKENKFQFFLMLRGLYYEQDWWVNIARDIDLEYIVLNKQVENNRGVGAEYLPDLETYLRAQFDAVPDHVEQLYENDSFVLYRLREPPEPDRDVLLFDTSWTDYLDTVFTRLDLSRCYDFQYISNYEGTPTDNRKVHVLATDENQAALDVWAVDHPGSFHVPSTKTFAFNSDVIASSYYLSPMFRLYLFFSDTKWNRTEMITPGIFGSLRGSFIGVPRPTQFTIPVVVPEEGRYRVLLRGAATANQLKVRSATLGYDHEVELRSPSDALQVFTTDVLYDQDRSPTDISGRSVSELESEIGNSLVPVNLRYTYHDLGIVDATPGAHSFVVDKLDANPMLAEGILLVPEEDHDGLVLPPELSLVDDVDDVDCSDQTAVRAGRSDSVSAIENGPHADLTEEELLELIGVEFATASPGGIGGRWIHLGTTVLLVLASLAVVRQHMSRRPDEDEAVARPGPLTADDMDWDDSWLTTTRVSRHRQRRFGRRG